MKSDNCCQAKTGECLVGFSKQIPIARLQRTEFLGLGWQIIGPIGKNFTQILGICSEELRAA
jgi:hypothetical protein